MITKAKNVMRTKLLAIPMHNAPVFIEQEASLKSAIDKMLQLKVQYLLVSDENKHVVGIITTEDLLTYLSSLLSHESEEGSVLLSMMNLRTLGDVANQLSNVGI